MMDRLQIGIWGCGGMGRSLARALVATDRADLAVAYDISSDAAQDLVAQFGGAAVPSATELLSYPALDGVIVALPPFLHADAVIRAAEAGLGVFVEKPMALHSDDCRSMIAAAERNKVRLMVGQVLRYYEPYRSIRRWAAEGRFGSIYAASIWRLSQGGTFASPGHWRARRETCGGYLYEVGAHEIDMLRCLMGRARTVYAVAQKALSRGHEIEDHIAVTLQFPSGGATYEGATASHVGRYGFRFFFEQATLTSNAPFDRDALEVHQMSGAPAQDWRDEFSSERPVESEIRDWLSALRDEIDVPISGAEGLATVALIEAAYRSAEHGEIVHMPADSPIA